MFPLGNLDTVWKNFYSQWVVGDLLSISIQFCWGRILCRSHFLCSVPCGERKFVNTNSGKQGINPRARQLHNMGRKSPRNQEVRTSSSQTSGSRTRYLIPFITLGDQQSPLFSLKQDLPRGANQTSVFIRVCLQLDKTRYRAINMGLPAAGNISYGLQWWDSFDSLNLTLPPYGSSSHSQSLYRVIQHQKVMN